MWRTAFMGGILLCSMMAVALAGALTLTSGAAYALTPTTTSLAAAPVGSSTLGQSVDFTATVTGSGATGQVLIYEGTVVIGSAWLDTGTAVFSTALLRTGPHSITAQYSGDASFSSSWSAVLSYTVGARATTLSASNPSPNPVAVGHKSTVMASVADTATTGPPGTKGIFTSSPVTMNYGRTGHTATMQRDGRVLIVGGRDSSVPPTVYASAELYDPGSGTFTTLFSGLNTARFGHTATLLQDGTMLITGGTTAAGVVLRSAELYDPITGTFSPLNNMVSLRTGHTATLMGNGLVVIAGGDNGGGKLATMEIYNPGHNSNTAPGFLSAARSDHTATLLSDGLSILFTGGDATGTAEFVGFSPLTTNPTTYSGTLPWATARSGQTATLLLDGNLLITGGLRSGVAVQSAELYQVPPSLAPFPTTFTTVIPVAGLYHARRNHTATLLNSGLILLTGGLDYHPAALKTTESYTPSFDPLGTIELESNDISDTLVSGTLSLGGTGATTCSAKVTPIAVDSGKRTLMVNYLPDANHTAPPALTKTLIISKGLSAIEILLLGD